VKHGFTFQSGGQFSGEPLHCRLASMA
jgi:hypothetical protein